MQIIYIFLAEKRGIGKRGKKRYFGGKKTFLAVNKVFRRQLYWRFSLIFSFCRFETLADSIWKLRTLSSWQMDLLKQSPLPNDQVYERICFSVNLWNLFENFQSLPKQITVITSIIEKLTKFLCVLISQSFIVSVQPEPVVKTQHKFIAEGLTLNIRFYKNETVKLKFALISN